MIPIQYRTVVAYQYDAVLRTAQQCMHLTNYCLAKLKRLGIDDNWEVNHSVSSLGKLPLLNELHACNCKYM